MTLSWQTILAIGAGGFLGAIARAYVVYLSNKHFSYDFPLGILFVNLLGSFLIGALFAIFAHFTVGDSLKSFLESETFKPYPPYEKDNKTDIQIIFGTEG